MIGTLINCAAVILGSAIGLLFRKGMSKKISNTVMQGVGLCVILIGLSGALETQNTLLVIISISASSSQREKSAQAALLFPFPCKLIVIS